MAWSGSATPQRELWLVRSANERKGLADACGDCLDAAHARVGELALPEVVRPATAPGDE